MSRYYADQAKDLAGILPEAIDRFEAEGGDVSKSIVSVSSHGFIVLCVPEGREADVAMVLHR